VKPSRRLKEDAVEPAAVAEKAAEPVEAAKPVWQRQPRKRPAIARSGSHARNAKAAPQRPNGPLNRANAMTIAAVTAAADDNDDREPNGFGDEIPAFMMIGS
jgi:hypothetical protein